VAGGVVFGLILATMMLPLQTTIIPVFLIIRDLGLSDSRGSLILPAIGSAFGTFLMRQYFLQMPHELGEAARVDGASHSKPSCESIHHWPLPRWPLWRF
jgi:multiple sugar transport system permease protein